MNLNSCASYFFTFTLIIFKFLNLKFLDSMQSFLFLQIYPKQKKATIKTSILNFIRFTLDKEVLMHLQRSALSTELCRVSYVKIMTKLN